MTMIYIPAGSFTMGSRDGDSYEQPEREVELTNAFWVDKTEVTNSMFVAFLNSQDNQDADENQYYEPNKEFSQIHPSDKTWSVDPGKDNYPVNYVSWFAARDYCSWVGARLPTEAEWEYAARGTDKRNKYPWGSTDPKTDKTLVNRLGIRGETASVGSFPNGASPFGILDMAGNVAEWVFDGASPSYSNLPITDPVNPIDPRDSNARYPVLRGGSYLSSPGALYTWRRFASNFPNTMDHKIGFRCAANQ